VLFLLDLAKRRGVRQGEENDLFAGHRADIVMRSSDQLITALVSGVSLLPGMRIITRMADDFKRAEAERAIHDLRAEADKLMERSYELKDQAVRLKQRADDLSQLLKQYAARDELPIDARSDNS